MISLVMSLTCSLSLLGALPQSQELSYSQLLERTYDLRFMCELPADGERSEQLRLEVADQEFEYVINGPAVITRVFTDSATGAFSVELNGDDFNAELSSLEEFIAAPFSNNYGNAVSINLPISIAKNATVRLAGSTATHIDLDVWYPALGASLVDSGNEFLKGQRRSIKAASDVFASNQRPVATFSPNPKKIGVSYFRSPELPPSSTNGEFRWLIRGAGVVRWFELKFIHKVAPAEAEELMRSLVLRIEHGCRTIEDEGTVVCEVPLGDFFGAYRGETNDSNYLLGYNQAAQTWYCRLPIPYTDSVRFSVASDIVAPARFTMVAGVDKLPTDKVPPLTLHSNFVRAVGQSQASAAQLNVTGIGRLVGAMFSSTSSSSAAVPQPNDFAFSDIQQLPSRSISEQVSMRQGPGAFGNNSASRWYGAAAPSAIKELNYSPGLLLAGDGKTDYSFSTWWYGKVDSKVAGASAYPVAQRIHPKNPVPNFFTIDRAIEAEHTASPRMSRGSTAEVVLVDGPQQFSSLQFTKWKPSDSMQAVIFDFTIADSGKYDFSIQFATGPEFGKVQVLIDGKATGDTIDCSADELGASGLLKIGEVRMMARDSHTIGFRSVDEKAVGIDCYVIEKL